MFLFMNNLIVRGIPLITEVYTTNVLASDNLFVPTDLYDNLSYVYTVRGMSPPNEKMKILVDTPKNKNPLRRMIRYNLEAEKLHSARLLESEPLCGYMEKNIALLSEHMMERMELEDKEKILLRASVPEPSSINDLGRF